MKKTALICGASRGIGAAFLNKLIHEKEFHRIYTLSRTGSVPFEIQRAAQLKEVELFHFIADVREPNSLANAVMDLEMRKVEIHLLVNFVGLLSSSSFKPEKSTRDFNWEQLKVSVFTNTWPAMLLTQQLKPFLRHKNECKMVFLSARVGSISDNHLGGWYSYRISKAALNMAMRCLALEMARYNPNLCCVSYHPGTVDTELSRPFTKRYKRNNIFTPSEAADYLHNLIGDLRPSKNGLFFDWKGESIEF
ncbi:MAG: SDR family NAD(P)-dependent oxidoreductase [Myxococcota bacterium]|nr:SDR family NAD(P)-dependent oxidoreductase [Myxococcota bacterium]